VRESDVFVAIVSVLGLARLVIACDFSTDLDIGFCWTCLPDGRGAACALAGPTTGACDSSTGLTMIVRAAMRTALTQDMHKTYATRVAKPRISNPFRKNFHAAIKRDRQPFVPLQRGAAAERRIRAEFSRGDKDRHFGIGARPGKCPDHAGKTKDHRHLSRRQHPAGSGCATQTAYAVSTKGPGVRIVRRQAPTEGLAYCAANF
jgi:hypothetical protein